MNYLPKILIIEDEPIILKALNAFLIQQYDVLLAADGEKGMEMIEQERPDLILLDLILPRLHGFEILRKIKNDTKIANIPVIILSNLNSINDINKSYELGAVDYLIKEQVNFEIIRFKIEMALNKKKSPEKVSKAGLMK